MFVNIIWCIVFVIAAFAGLGVLAGFFFFLISDGEPLPGQIALVCLVVAIVAGCLSTATVSEETRVVDVQVTHMDQTETKYSMQYNVSYVETLEGDNDETVLGINDDRLAGVIEVKPDQYALLQVGDPLTLEVTVTTNRMGDTYTHVEILE